VIYLELKDFVGKPCTTKVSYEYFPKKKVKLDLDIATKEVSNVGEIEIKSRVLLILKVDNKTVSIFKNGKIVVRGEKDELKSREVAKKVCEALTQSVTEKKGLFGLG
jgi:TATA-box binding protein (TBP) (component of TFIID and TFIIIB)